jgi:hypothetical protein
MKEGLREASATVAELIEREAATQPPEKLQVTMGRIDELVADEVTTAGHSNRCRPVACAPIFRRRTKRQAKLGRERIINNDVAS